MVTILSTQTTSVVMDTYGEFAILPEGEIISFGSFGIVFVNDTQDSFGLIQGTVAGGVGGILVGQSGSGLSDNNTVSVGSTGTVIGQSQGISVYGDNTTIVNHGDIQGLSSAAIFGFSDGSGLNITNTGTISGGSYGLRLLGELADVANAGTITGDVGISISGDGTFVQNTGTIIGTSGPAVTFSTGSLGTEIFNSGTISGAGSAATAGTAILGSASAQVVRNSGTILGDVNMGGGNDELRMWGDGVVAGTIDMGSGDDTVYGSRFDDVIDGGSGEDVIRGRGGDDTIHGEGDSDELRGNDGDDDLFGGDGDDTLYGGGGADVLSGGAGQEFMFGGTGADVFDFDEAKDTGLTNSTRDSIRDFEVGVDLIDLSDWIFPEFDFIGTSGFSGSGSGEIRLRIVNGNTFIRIDEDGDGIQDAQIFVRDVTTLTEADFIL